MKRIQEDKLFMNAFHFSSIGMAIVSTKGKWLKVNKSLCRILGYSEAELVQMTFQDLTYSEDLELDLTNVNRMLEGEIDCYQMEKRYIHKQNKIVWVLLSVSLVKDEKKNPLYFISQIEDITERKDLIEKLEKSEAKYRSWIQYSPEPMVIHSEGKVEYINEAGVNSIGARDYKELMGKNIMGIIHPDYLELVTQRMKESTMANKQLEPYEIKIIALNGKTLDVRISSIPIDYQGKHAYQVIFSNITQQKEMEAAIRKNEAQYKSLIEQNPDAVLAIDSEGRLIQTNKNCTRITGYTEEELLISTFHSLIVEEDLEKSVISFSKVLQGDTETIDVTINKKHGDKAILNVTSVPIYIDQTITGVYTVAKDITEQRRIEKELQVSNERFKAIFDKSGIGIILRNGTGEILEVNPTYLNMLGYSKEEVCDLADNIYHPDDVEEEKRLFTELVEGKRTSYQLEKRYIRKDGKLLYANVTVNALTGLEEGSIFAIGMVHDITDRKHSEKLMIESEERYRSVVELYPEGLFVHGKEDLKFINERTVELIGAANMQEVLEQPFINFIHPDQQQNVVESIDLILKGKLPVPLKDEVKYIRKDGKVFIGELTVTKIKYDEETCILGVIRDITKQKAINEKLEELSRIDGLTAIANRRSFDEELAKEWKRASINSTPLSLIMLDIDHFKAYNDTYGHSGGDECLKTIAQTLKNSIKFHSDFVARYGGEEFSVILPETSQEEAKAAANRLRSIIEELSIPHIGSKVSQYVTISLGVSTVIPTSQMQSKELIEKADKALYYSKGSGRNQVGVYIN
ncbi:PAS domain S-box protein [Bacillus sp. FJAT-45350]|uniref:PAS domain S-box protein n=1 Tax=Bacillus sp. FJAT-45350 TaxID=2011014 RepID=UPI000BB94825|nr:PAS domain S-box protein [Bacillus sp. FJAT-45350]